jgi:outer membrane receptor protein involved in Fe transport
MLFHFDLPAQSLAETLRAIGSTTNTDIGFAVNQVAGLVAPALRADLTIDAALARVLAGTGFRPRHLNGHTIVIAAMGSASSSSVHRRSDTPSAIDSLDPTSTSSHNLQTYDRTSVLHLAYADSSQPEVDNSNPVEEDNTKALQDVVVTGSHLRGVTDTGSSMQVITSDDIDRAGFGTVSDLVQSLSQAFGNDVTANTVASVRGGAGDNETTGTGIDLRGLGATSTLVLVNGRRIAPSNSQEEGYIDVSTIPLAAIDRVEIVPDGASAIYGSDAVGGVVNFILKHDFEGADTRVRYGTVTQGSSREIDASQTFGHHWDTGSALLSYEYYDRSPLSAADRSFSDTATLPFTLLPEQQRQSVYATASDQVSPAVELFADGNYSRQTADQILHSTTFFLAIPSDNYSYNATLGGRISLPANYELSVSTSYSESALGDKVLFNAPDAPLTSSHASVLSTEANLNGTLARLPSGPISIAIGSQFRREALDAVDPFSTIPFIDSRTVIAGYAEANVPIIGSVGLPSGVNRLALTLADRYERYSDFGSTNNPKVGFVFWPEQYIKLRGSYGRSFRAPGLIDLNPSPNATGAVLNYDPLTGTNRPIVDIFGGNPDLTPETARTWSFGIDLSPDLLSGLKASATYYRIRYNNRISSAAAAGYDSSDGLSMADVLGPNIVQRNPSLAAVEAIAALPNFENLTGIPGPLDLSSVAAILYFNSQNLSEVNTSGIDFSISYTTNLHLFNLETGVTGTYILKFDNQFESTTPVSSILNTPYDPIDLHLRGKWIMSRGNVRLGLFLNYVNSYMDNRGVVTVPLASWTTFDMSLNYKLPWASGLLTGTNLSLNIKNITNVNPPYVPADSIYPINYDGTNANPLGRFVSLQIDKKW